MLLLFLAAILYSIDKAIVGVLAEPIRADLGLGDVQMGLLLGMAYSLLSGICGLWLGTLIDRRTRCRVLAAAIALWSLSTAAGGLAPGFASFFVFRALVGLGEAAVAPAALSLIADMFTPGQRGRALSAYLIGASIGTALSSIVPGWIIAAQLHLTLPFYGVVTPWRSAFLLCGMAGPVVALLFLTVREPARRGFPARVQNVARVGDKLRFLWGRRALFVPIVVGFCLFYIAFVGVTAWTAAFLSRRYDVSLPVFANALGLAMLASGMAGYLSAGLIADSRFGRGPGGKLRIMMLLPLIALPAGLATFAPGYGWALLAISTITFATPVLNVAVNASIQDLVPNDMRGFTLALLSVVSALPAGAGGPLFVAFATEQVLKNEQAIGTSFLLVCVPSLLLSSIAFWMARRQAPNSPNDVPPPFPQTQIA